MVKVVDKLSVDNSTLVLGEEGYLMDHYSTRQLDVIEYYKDDLNLGNSLLVNEGVALTKNNELIQPENYNAMEKGKKYVVYITDNSASGYLYIMSSSNGRVNIDDFKNHVFEDIAFRSILMVEGIDIPANVKLNYSEKKTNKDVVTVNLKKTSIIVKVNTDPSSGTQSIELGDVYVEASSPIILE